MRSCIASMLSACLPKADWLAFMSLFKTASCLEICESPCLYSLSPIRPTFVLMPSLLFATLIPPLHKKGTHR